MVMTDKADDNTVDGKGTVGTVRTLTGLFLTTQP